MGRILIIEDDNQVRDFIREVLMLAHHKVVEAKDWLEGERLYRASPTDLIVMDVFMPCKERLQAMQDFRKEFPHVKTIAITGGFSELHDDFLNMAKKIGACRTIPKPLAPESLLEAVEEELHHLPPDFDHERRIEENGPHAFHRH